MVARVTHYRIREGKVDEFVATVESLTAAMDKLKGFRVLLVLHGEDKSRREAMAISVWDSAEDLRDSDNNTFYYNVLARVDLNRNLLIQNQELRYASSKVPNFLLDVQRNSYSLVGASRNVKCVTIYSTRRIPTIQSANVLLCVSRKSSAASPYRTASTPSMP